MREEPRDNVGESEGSQHQVLTSVQQLADGVEVAGVHGGLDENVDDDVRRSGK